MECYENVNNPWIALPPLSWIFVDRSIHLFHNCMSLLSGHLNIHREDRCTVFYSYSYLQRDILVTCNFPTTFWSLLSKHIVWYQHRMYCSIINAKGLCVADWIGSQVISAYMASYCGNELYMSALNLTLLPGHSTEPICFGCFK